MRNLLDLDEDLAPLQAELAGFLVRVSDRFDAALTSDLLAVERLTRHVERYRGKMLRPALVALCGSAASGMAMDDLLAGEAGVDLAVVAAVCEMVHMATLVHDDVLDEAETRRRGQTVNAMSGNETAVILGDYLIAGAYHLCSTLDRQATALRVGRASMIVCSGELLQLDRREDYAIDEATYFEIIERKTAELIAAACELGAQHAGSGGPQRDALASFGRRIGVAFQIRDDLLDLTGREEIVGKSVGRDVRKGKVTLPIMHHLAEAGAATRAETLALIERAEAGDDHAAAQVRARMDGTGSIEHTQAVAERIVEEARGELAVLADTPARRMLDAMARAVVERSF
ncbi:MAG: polyprenyl synthetase family protein [Planctomycetota bacterium]